MLIIITRMKVKKRYISYFLWVFFNLMWQHEIENSNPFHKICKFTCKNFTYGYHMTNVFVRQNMNGFFFISDK